MKRRRSRLVRRRLERRRGKEEREEEEEEEEKEEEGCSMAVKTVRLEVVRSGELGVLPAQVRHQVVL